jgi:hypothetical protein
MTKEELLIPRYKCIAPMPFDRDKLYNVGDIFTDDGKVAVRNQHGDPVYPIDWATYPHLFKPLHWWEERELSELPEYIMFAKDYAGFKDGQVFKTENWNKQNEAAGYCIGFLTGTGEYDKCAVPINCGLLPATKEEYESYIRQKEGRDA